MQDAARLNGASVSKPFRGLIVGAACPAAVLPPAGAGLAARPPVPRIGD